MLIVFLNESSLFAFSFQCSPRYHGTLSPCMCIYLLFTVCIRVGTQNALMMTWAESEYLVHTIYVQCLLLNRTTLDCVVRLQLYVERLRTLPNTAETPPDVWR